MENLLHKSACSQLTLLLNKEISTEDLVKSSIERIEKVNPKLNAIVAKRYDEALFEAKEHDQKRLLGNNDSILQGLPIVHKDNIPVQGLPCTNGSPIYKNNIVKENDPLVTSLNNDGAIVLGMTNMPEFGAGSHTFNNVYGTTLNPYDTKKTCGGSSGGAAVALSSGMCSLATGSDMGGSLRNPAGYCNIVGFRASPQQLPSLFSKNEQWKQMGLRGPMARRVCDVALFYNLMTKHRNNNLLQVNHVLESLKQNFNQTKIAFSSDFGILPVAKSIKNVVKKSVLNFNQLNAHIENDCIDFTEANDLFQTLRAWLFNRNFGQDYLKNKSLIKSTVQWNIEKGIALTNSDLEKAKTLRDNLDKKAKEFFAKYDFLVLPVSQVEPFDIETEYPIEIECVKMITYIDWMKSCSFISALGLTAISVPTGFTDSGLPVGLQIVAPAGKEWELLQLANAYESLTQFYKKIPTF